MPRPPQSGDLIAARYELEQRVGSGGMSSVFRAHDTELDRTVAIKILHERFADDAGYVDRFRREARAVAALTHPNIVTVIDRGEDEGRQYIVFEYVDGESLKELVVREGRLPLRRATELALGIADGLAFAHGQGLVHRDVKPQNVLLGGEGQVKVTDFGIARSLDVEHGMTETGTVLGTGSYLAPEQARGEPVTPATDVYALGVVLWELLTGSLPFSGESLVEVALQHAHEPLPSLRERRPDVPPRLAAAVERALAKEPEGRYPSMDALAAELRAALVELGAEQPPVAAAEATLALPAVSVQNRSRRPRRRRVAYVLAGAAVIAAALAAAVAMLLVGSSRTHRGSGGGTSGGGTAGAAVRLQGVTDYDPQGDGSELSSTAPRATDGNPSTYWATETYATEEWGNLKSGLGLVLDAGHGVKLTRLTVRTTTPGFRARIEVGSSESGPFAPDSTTKTVGTRTTFALRGRSGRYWVVWLTRLGPQRTARITEVTAAR